jgi:hypothetical protein
MVETALIAASPEWSREAIVNLLLSRKDIVNTQTKMVRRALLLRNGHEAIVKHLLPLAQTLTQTEMVGQRSLLLP